MRANFARILGSTAGLVSLAACVNRDGNSPVAPVFDVAPTTYTISGQVLGPDGTSICNALPSGTTYAVSVLGPVNGFFTRQVGLCAGGNGNTYSIAVEAGTYRVRGSVLTGPLTGTSLPTRWLEPGDVVVTDANVTKDIQVFEGAPVGGGVTLDGAPIADVQFSLGYDFLFPAFGAAFGISQADGSWRDDFVERSPMLIQSGVRYQTDGCSALGASTVSFSPTEPFLFPTEASAVDCTLVTGSATTFSHTLTRLVVTPMPGDIGGQDIGGQSAELFATYGRGWGVQFPVTAPSAPVHAPVAATRLFRGGLIIGLPPSTVLAGFEYFQPRALGLDGTVTTRDRRDGGKRVTWRYSDASSLEGVGLKVVQHSVDGRSPNDYVLFQFVFTNTASSKATFYAGFFGDWDLNDVGDPTDDVGFTELDGNLMYVTNDGEVGVHIGTLLLGDFPIAGNFFRTNPPGTRVTLAEQMAAISGTVRNPTSGPQDQFYWHTVGPITVKPRQSADIWIAIVAGDDKAQLLANAAAAQAHVARRE